MASVGKENVDEIGLAYLAWARRIAYNGGNNRRYAGEERRASSDAEEPGERGWMLRTPGDHRANYIFGSLVGAPVIAWGRDARRETRNARDQQRRKL